MEICLKSKLYYKLKWTQYLSTTNIFKKLIWKRKLCIIGVYKTCSNRNNANETYELHVFGFTKVAKR